MKGELENGDQPADWGGIYANCPGGHRDEYIVGHVAMDVHEWGHGPIGWIQYMKCITMVPLDWQQAPKCLYCSAVQNNNIFL